MMQPGSHGGPAVTARSRPSAGLSITVMSHITGSEDSAGLGPGGCGRPSPQRRRWRGPAAPPWTAPTVIEAGPGSARAWPTGVQAMSGRYVSLRLNCAAGWKCPRLPSETATLAVGSEDSTWLGPGGCGRPSPQVWRCSSPENFPFYRW